MTYTKAILIGFAVFLSACATTSEVLKPAIEMPAAYKENTLPTSAALTIDWWNAFGSQELAALVDTALRENPDIAIAGERVRQAEAQTRIANASLFPFVSAGAGTSRRGSDTDGNSSRSDSTGVDLDASYELDLWGLNAADRRSARALLSATDYDRENIRLTLTAGVANAYFQVLSLRGRLQVARANLEIAERVFNIVEIRNRNGVVSALDVARQQTAVLEQRAAIPALELQERQTLHALAILVGRPPESFDVKGLNVETLSIPSVAPGLPAELLVRRPDLAAAEAQLMAANANLAAARAALLPSVQLSASIGVGADRFVSLASPHTATYAIAASVLQTIFDGGRLRAQVDIAGSRERELVENYRRAILAALADVEDALVASDRSAEQQRLQIEAREQARRALRLAEVRYREGADDLLSVLDAQRSFFSAEDTVAQLQLSRLQASVGMYKALGGGWQTNQALP